MRIARVLAAVTLLVSTAAISAPTLGFGVAGKVSPGGRADTLLTHADIESAILAGIREAGVELNETRHSVPAVSLDYTTVYAPDARNMRVLTTGIALREDVVVRGKHRTVAVCDWGSTSWTAGDNESNHVRTILNSARELGRTFAEKCLR